MLKIIIGIVIVLGVIGWILEQGGNTAAGLALFAKEGGMLGKVCLALIVIAIGCILIELITGMYIMVDIAKGCIALVVVLIISRVIKMIFKS